MRTEGTLARFANLNYRIADSRSFTTFIKSTIGRAAYEATQEIRNEYISRDEGVAIVEKFHCEFPSKYFKEFPQFGKRTEDEFWQMILKNRSPYFGERDVDRWALRFKVSKGLD